MAGAGEGGTADGGTEGAKRPPETRDALGMILDAGGLEMPPQPPPGYFVGPEDSLPDDVVPVAGDSSGPEDTPAAPPPDDVVPIAGDGAGPADPPDPPAAPPPVDLPSLDRPNPFVPDDDDDDDDDEPESGGNTWLKIALIALAAVVAVALGVYFLTSGSSKAPVSAPPSTPAPTAPAPARKSSAPTCPPPLKLEHLTVGAMDHECAGPAQYKSQPTSPYYSYFAWEFTYGGRQVQFVVTGGPLKGAVHTAAVSPNLSAVSSSGGKLADVDLYDNASGKKSFATTGTLTLDPRGSVRFRHVEVMFEGKKTLIQGRLMTP